MEEYGSNLETSAAPNEGKRAENHYAQDNHEHNPRHIGTTTNEPELEWHRGFGNDEELNVRPIIHIES